MGTNETETTDSALVRIHARLRESAAREANPGWDKRDAWLAALERLIRENQPAISEAIRSDFGNRSLHETQLLELFPSLEAIRHARRHLKSWMRPERRAVSMWFLPGRARVLHQPLGVVGIIVPWNYPLYLAVGPLTAALAAGNRAMVKMSEYTPAFSALFGCLPDYVDGHQHVQIFPQIRDAALSVMRETLPDAWMRQCGRVTPLAATTRDQGTARYHAETLAASGF